MLAVVALGFGTALAIRPAPQTIERIVYVPISPSHVAALDSTMPDASATMALKRQVEHTGGPWAYSAGYVQQRDQVIRWGVDVIPPSPSLGSSSPPISIESMLGLPKEKPEQQSLFLFKF
jgi:hypothetical protein